ncbi:MAG: hypothetical protein R3B96_25470 [Pirellulaceae bacterium]
MAKIKLISRLMAMGLAAYMVFDRQSWRLNGWLQAIFADARLPGLVFRECELVTVALDFTGANRQL